MAGAASRTDGPAKLQHWDLGGHFKGVVSKALEVMHRCCFFIVQKSETNTLAAGDHLGISSKLRKSNLNAF